MWWGTGTLVGTGMLVLLMLGACEAAGKHYCDREPVLELEDGKCVFTRSCAGELSRLGACQTVRVLQLHSLAITSLADSVFAELGALEVLHLSHNDLLNVTEGVDTRSSFGSQFHALLFCSCTCQRRPFV